MAARFPVSGSSVAYRIKPAWASKIHAIWWAASADSVHQLVSGGTSTTIVTRATSGATFDGTNAIITGTTTTPFSVSVSGGFGGLAEDDNFTMGVGYYGDCFYGLGSNKVGIHCDPFPDAFESGSKVFFQDYEATVKVAGGYGGSFGGVFSNDVVDYMTLCMRYDQADPSNDVRAWANGTETAIAANGTSGSSELIGDTSTPLLFGEVKTGTGNTKAHFECAWIGAALSDADMATITTNPADVIEAYTAPPPDIEVPLATIELTGFAPTVFDPGAPIAAPVGSIELTAFAPIVQPFVSITDFYALGPDLVIEYSYAGTSATLNYDKDSTPQTPIVDGSPSGTITISDPGAGVYEITSLVITDATGTATDDSPPASVEIVGSGGGDEGAVSIEVPVGSVTITGLTPSVADVVSEGAIEIPLATIELTAFAPTVFDPGLVIEIPLAEIEITAQTPTMAAATRVFHRVRIRGDDGTVSAERDFLVYVE